MIDASTTPDSLTVSVAQVSGVGGRQTNQDALGSVQRGDLACFVVSDGAGGHEGGEIASKIVVQSVVAGFELAMSAGEPFNEAVLQSCIAHAVAEVARGKEGIDHLESMSATVAAVLVDRKRGQSAWAHLGDTRVYLFRDGRLLHMTKDHSLIQQVIDAGLADGADARTDPRRNLLYAAIGAENDVPPAIQPLTALRSGDAILICTDGLWEWVTEDAMEHCCSHAGNAREWLAALCAAADENSAASAKTRDNFTAQALWIRDADADAAPAEASFQPGQATP
jgi:PPM family protein phosphatase